MTSENDNAAVPSTENKVAPKKAVTKKAVTNKSAATASKIQPSKKADAVASISSNRVWPD